MRDDVDVIKFRNHFLRNSPAKEFNLNIQHGISFRYRIVGSSEFAAAVSKQMSLIMQNSRHGKILLLELAKLKHVIDIVEYKTSTPSFKKC